MGQRQSAASADQVAAATVAESTQALTEVAEPTTQPVAPQSGTAARAQEDNGALIGAVRVLARLHRMLEATDSGLTVPQYRVLAAIAQGGVRSAHLAERLAVRRPTLTAIADGLVAAGYARRGSEAGDRRVVMLHATDEGRAVLARADRAYVERFERLLGDLPEDNRFIDDLIAVGEALDARLRADLPTPAPTA